MGEAVSFTEAIPAGGQIGRARASRSAEYLGNTRHCEDAVALPTEDTSNQLFEVIY